MVDLIVPAGGLLRVDAGHPLGTKYGLFRMEAGARIVAEVDLTIIADRAEFADSCIIDASGAAGVNGVNGVNGPLGVSGTPGAGGTAGQRGRNVTIVAALAKVGGLTIS